MKAFKAICVEAGGGYVRLMVERDAPEYPADGERVVVWSRPPSTKTSNTRPPSGEQPRRDARAGSGS